MNMPKMQEYFGDCARFVKKRELVRGWIQPKKVFVGVSIAKPVFPPEKFSNKSVLYPDPKSVIHPYSCAKKMRV